MLFIFFFKLLRAYAAQGAFVVFGQLFALVNITAYGAYIFFHNFLPHFIVHSRQIPVKLS